MVLKPQKSPLRVIVDSKLYRRLQKLCKAKPFKYKDVKFVINNLVEGLLEREKV